MFKSKLSFSLIKTKKSWILKHVLVEQQCTLFKGTEAEHEKGLAALI